MPVGVAGVIDLSASPVPVGMKSSPQAHPHGLEGQLIEYPRARGLSLRCGNSIQLSEYRSPKPRQDLPPRLRPCACSRSTKVAQIERP
jgi:hypothetical protein